MTYEAVITELESVRDALEAEDRDRLDTALTGLTDAYERVRPDERSRVARLQAARTESELSPEDQRTISTYERWFMTAYFGRGSLLAGSELYLFDPDETDPAELSEQVTGLIDREKGVRDATAATDEVLEAASVPPRIAILSFGEVEDEQTALIGDDHPVELELANVGDEPATGVTIGVTTTDTDIETDESIGRLDPDDRYVTEFDLPLSSGGEIEVTATVESETAGSVSETHDITVRTKTSIVKTAIDALETLGERLTESDASRGTTRSVTSKLDAAAESLSRALEAIERGRERQSNNAIKTATKQLGALLNSLEASRGGAGKGKGNPSLERDVRTMCYNRTELLIDHLTDARRTSIA